MGSRPTTRGVWRLGAGLALIAGTGACGGAGDTPGAAAGVADGADVFTERVVVFMTAGPEAIAEVRGERSDEEFAVIADDLMWYRAQAGELLDEAGIPVHRVVDRQPLDFLVGDSVRTYAFEEQPSLDLLVAYDPGREPLAVAPIGIEQVLAYFERSATRSAALPRDPPGSPSGPARASTPP